MTSEEIGKIFRTAGLEPLSGKALVRFESYLALLLRWNSKLNLTAVREPQAIVHRHFVECVQCAQELPELGSPQTLLDFGSGAGLPGIPIAICRPDVRVTMAESQRKKAAFLREAVRVLELKAEIFDGRVEEMAKEQLFHAVTLRAVDRMVEACELATHRLTPKGWLILFSTQLSADPIQSCLTQINWSRELPILGLKQGVLLFGRTVDVPHGT